MTSGVRAASLPTRPHSRITLPRLPSTTANCGVWRKVRRVFGLIDAIEKLGIDPCDVAPDHWRHIHNRLIVAETPRSYSTDRHRAWLARKALQS